MAVIITRARAIGNAWNMGRNDERRTLGKKDAENADEVLRFEWLGCTFANGAGMETKPRPVRLSEEMAEDDC
ncbi:MAG TPA: hypothetical protein VGR97_04570 [Candidatus Acidoferrales bacterium]|nr:hypothetical protein [Candidatus Acidoferrales bacterium]